MICEIFFKTDYSFVNTLNYLSKRLKISCLCDLKLCVNK